MRFEDEQYVRLYKRDSTTWKMVPWQSRCILPLILRKLDRAGILDLGGDGMEALAVHIEVPLEVVEAGMAPLLRRGVLVLRADGVLVWPKFIEGQEAKQSDKARQKSARDRARDLASAVDRGIDITAETVTPRDAGVTPRDDDNTPRDANVTRGHAASQGVTLSSAQLNSAEPSSVRRTRTKKPPEEGTRLPSDWVPSPGLLAWAKGKGVIDADVRAAADRFRDHWLASVLPSAVKASWEAAFRTWVGRDIESGKIVARTPTLSIPVLAPTSPAQLEMKRTATATVAAAIAEMTARTAGGTP